MTIQVVPHLNFRGEARSALEFYRSVFGGQLTIATYADMRSADKPADAELVMWGQVAATNGFNVMAFDATEKLPFDKGQNAFYVSVRFDSNEEAEASWKKLASGGAIRRELAPAPWGAALYGMVQDRFGVVWVIDVAPAAQQDTL